MGDSWGEAEEGARRYPSAQSLSCNCRVTGSASDSHALHVVEESTAIRPYVLDGSAGEKTAKLTSNGASGATDDEPHEAAKTPRPGYKCHPHADRGTTRRMIEVVRCVVGLAADVVRRRAGLVAENAVLRQQLIVAQRKIAGRVRWAPWQRFTMGLAARMAPAWRDATLLVQPATILRWHQAAVARSGADALSRRVDPLPRVRRLSERWPPAIRAGARSVSAASCSSSASASAREPSSDTCVARGPAATGNAGRPSCGITSRGRATSCRPTTSGSARCSCSSSSTLGDARSSTPQ